MGAEKQLPFESRPSTTPGTLLFPKNSAEFVTAFAHYYRGELSRMMSWRQRIDLTTNWAIGAVAAMLSISLSSPSSHHAILVFAMVIVYMLLMIEARRYRFFDVYRTRLRKLERLYFAPMFDPQENFDAAAWLSALGEDLRRPRFTISLLEAMSRRLRRTYAAIFLILLLAWLLKITSALLQSTEASAIDYTAELLVNAAIVGIPGWVVLSCISAFYVWLTYVIVRHSNEPGELAHGQVHV